MHHSLDDVLARIAPVGKSRIGDPATQGDGAGPLLHRRRHRQAEAPETDDAGRKAADTTAHGCRGPDDLQPTPSPRSDCSTAGGAVDIAAGEQI